MQKKRNGDFNIHYKPFEVRIYIVECQIRVYQKKFCAKPKRTKFMISKLLFTRSKNKISEKLISFQRLFLCVCFVPVEKKTNLLEHLQNVTPQL